MQPVDMLAHGLHDAWNENGKGYRASAKAQALLDEGAENDHEMENEIEHLYSYDPSGEDDSEINKFKILSQYKTGVAAGMYRFENEYKPGRWRLMENYRAPVTKQGVKTKTFASTVVIDQYRKVSQANNFYGELPKVILRWDVVNEKTNALTEPQEGDPKSPAALRKRIMERFLTETDNGKHTQRVLESLDMEATDVIKHKAYYDAKKGQDITVIAVYTKIKEPESAVDRELFRRELERSLQQQSRNRISRTLHSIGRRMSKCIRPATAD